MFHGQYALCLYSHDPKRAAQETPDPHFEHGTAVAAGYFSQMQICRKKGLPSEGCEILMRTDPDGSELVGTCPHQSFIKIRLWFK